MNFEHTIEDNIVYFIFEGDLIGENNGPELVEIAVEVSVKGI